MRRIEKLPGAERVAVGNVVPWRDAGNFGPGFQFAAEGYTPADGEENPPPGSGNVTPGFFATLGVPIVAGRDFTEDDRGGKELVVIVSQSVAAVSRRRCAQPPRVVDRPLFRQTRTTPHRRRRGGRGR